MSEEQVMGGGPTASVAMTTGENKSDISHIQEWAENHEKSCAKGRRVVYWILGILGAADLLTMILFVTEIEKGKLLLAFVLDYIK